MEAVCAYCGDGPSLPGTGEQIVWYVHGANSTPRSFAWLRGQMPAHQSVEISYDHSRPLAATLEALKHHAASHQPFAIVAHSIGGVLALGIAAAFPQIVTRVVTLATPFEGCRSAAMLRWLAPCTLYDDIHPYSGFITGLRCPPVPVLSLVSTAGGSPMMRTANDGVVTVASQQYLQGPTYHQVPVNHFEILLDEHAASLTRDFIFMEPDIEHPERH